MAFLISTNGYIVTNAHVVKNKRGMAQFSSGETEEVARCIDETEKKEPLLKVLIKE